MNKGWVKFHRGIVDWEWYKDQNTFRLFMHLVITANWEDKKWKGETVQRGSLITSQKHLSDDTGLSVKQVRLSLNKLKGTGEVAVRATSKFSHVTLCNYDTYQSKEVEKGEVKGEQAGTRRALKGQQLKKERKKRTMLILFFQGLTSEP